MSAVLVRGIEKSFGDVKVLRGVDLEVQRGSIVALLGSNGAGKTTLISILSTLLRPDAGSASVEGADVVERPGDVRESISLTGSSPPSTRSSRAGRTSSWWRGCATRPTPAASPTSCWSGSTCPTPADAGSAPTPAGCDVVSTSP